MRGLNLPNVAELTRLSPRVLALIDNGDFGALPAGLQGRAHLRAYARAVGLDAAEIVAALADRVPAVPDPLEALRVRVRQRFAADHPMAAALCARAQALRRRAGSVVHQGLPGRRWWARRWWYIGASAIDAGVLAGVSALMLLLSARLTNAGVDDVWRAARWPLVGAWCLTMVLYFTVSRNLTGRSTGTGVVVWLSRMREHRPQQSAARGHAR